MSCFYSTHYYRSGDEIRAGDCISYGGRRGHVVFVLGSANLPPDWADWASTEDWLGKKDAEGFMLDVEGMGLVFEPESDEDLEFFGAEAIAR